MINPEVLNMVELNAKHKCHGGEQRFYQHQSRSTQCTMQFSIFLPPQVFENNHRLPALLFLSGLTCTPDNFTTKAGAQKKAAELGIILVAPDTSPRGDHIAGHDSGYDLGTGASFYVNATQYPWKPNYQMDTYINDELLSLICSEFPVNSEQLGIMGHSMGGHGALINALKYPHLYGSVSAFAPVVAPIQVPWGQKAFQSYLGDDRQQWAKHDACELIKNNGWPKSILVDQGTNDQFLDNQLKPHLLDKACSENQVNLDLRMQEGYDHSYYFISSFIDDHLAFHLSELNAI